MPFKNFTLKEMLTTTTGLSNFPETFVQIENLLKTAAALQFIRDIVKFPIRVNSAFRSEAVNNKVGGVSTSAHRLGLAADICAYSEERNRELYDAIDKFVDYDQLIMYNQEPGNRMSKIRFIHLGLCNEKPRKQKLFK